MTQSQQSDSGPRAGRPVTRIALPLALAAVLSGSGWFVFQQASQPHLNALPLVRQATPYTCGVASLESVLAYYGQEWREDSLAQELKADPDNGTDYREIVRFAREKGLQVECAENMTVEDLRRAADQDRPVIVAIQAWGDHPESYAEGWEDGHYSIVVGVDGRNVYLMDPSTIGNYTFIPIQDFLARWHDYYVDRDGRKVRLVHFGMVFGAGSKPAFEPRALKPLQ
jgi:predicted double-glycine peptidase